MAASARRYPKLARALPAHLRSLSKAGRGSTGRQLVTEATVGSRPADDACWSVAAPSVRRDRWRLSPSSFSNASRQESAPEQKFASLLCVPLRTRGTPTPPNGLPRPTPAPSPAQAPTPALSPPNARHASRRCDCPLARRFPYRRASGIGPCLSRLAIGMASPIGSGHGSAGPSPVALAPVAWGCSADSPFSLAPV